MHIYDLIAMIDNCNPFPNENEALKAKLIKYRDSNPDEFRTQDWLENIHTLATYEPAEESINKLFGVQVNQQTMLSGVPNLSYNVKQFFVKFGNQLGISNELRQWAGTNTEPVTKEEVVEDEVDEDVEDEDETEDEEEENIVTNEPFVQEFDTNTVAINELSTYNFSSNYTISYEELARMCINQARKSYVSSKTRDMENQKAENERREKLYTEILKFFDLPEIKTEYVSAKLDQMSISELEQLQKQCEDKFDMLKTKDMIKHGLTLAKTGYYAILPNGIPLGKTRRLVIDEGVTNEISSSLFDVRTVPGLAFRRILDKHHVHLSDEVSVLLEIAKILIEGSHVIKRKDEEEDAEEDEEEEDAEEEEEEELIELDN